MKNHFQSNKEKGLLLLCCFVLFQVEKVPRRNSILYWFGASDKRWSWIRVLSWTGLSPSSSFWLSMGPRHLIQTITVNWGRHSWESTWSILCSYGWNLNMPIWKMGKCPWPVVTQWKPGLFLGRSQEEQAVETRNVHGQGLTYVFG